MSLGEDTWRVTIGRAPECEVQLTWDGGVSRIHALLERVGAEWTLVDDGLSRNGSFVNGARVLSRQRLEDQDRLRFGDTDIVFRAAGPGVRVQTVTGAIESFAPVPITPTQRRVLIALCRPVHESASATPATNRQIAAEVFLSIDAVKAHLRVMFERFGLSSLPQNEKRARLVATVLEAGVLSPHEF
jgi:pSer/pThr/pTyr-binding forkhead associated (FHA) protein